MLTLDAPVPDQQMTASEFVTLVAGSKPLQRDAVARDTLLAGHVPDLLRTFVQLQVPFKDKVGASHVVDLNVLYDYLLIGTDDDCLRIPLNPLNAQKVADAWGCMLPTTQLVSLIWKGAALRVEPQPWGPPYDATMQSTSRLVEHDKRIDASYLKKGFNPAFELEGRIIAGHKKDVVITKQLVGRPKQVAIFGWHQGNGKPIQPLYLGHENTYADYSHGIRLVSLKCKLDGIDDDLGRLLKDPVLCVGLSNEGPLTSLRQPDA